MRSSEQIKIAVLIPCYNEELTIAEVVRQFRRQLPLAEVYVFDNGSTDRTAEKAHEAGAIVCREGRRGKGHVVQSMFRQIEADIYVMVDGDGTYRASEVHRLIAPLIRQEAGMVVGARWLERSRSKSKPLNLIGNNFFLTLVNALFGTKLSDVLSGYRGFSREFVKGMKLTRGGFETEVELTIKAMRGGWRIIEVPVSLSERPPGSYSKIKLWRDGVAILHTILSLSRESRASALSLDELRGRAMLPLDH